MDEYEDTREFSSSYWVHNDKKKIKQYVEEYTMLMTMYGAVEFNSLKDLHEED